MVSTDSKLIHLESFFNVRLGCPLLFIRITNIIISVINSLIFLKRIFVLKQYAVVVYN